MKRYQGIFLAIGACLALLAGILLHHSQMLSLTGGGVASGSAQQAGLPSVDGSGSALTPDANTQGNSTPTSTSVGGGSGGAHGPSSTSLGVKAAAVENLATGALLYQYQPGLRWPLASMTKLMTAEIVSDRMDLSQVVTMQTSDFAGGPDTLTADLKPGDEYRASDLLRVMLIPSSNEAAEAFARTYGRNQFIATMNAQAATWELMDTHFDDPSGLSAADQSTPTDFLDLVRHVYAMHPEVFAITQSRAANVEDLATGEFKQFVTTNDFVGSANFIGGKTGTTPQAGDNLLSIFQIKGQPIAIVVFGAADRYAASRILLQWLQTDPSALSA